MAKKDRVEIGVDVKQGKYAGQTFSKVYDRDKVPRAWRSAASRLAPYGAICRHDDFWRRPVQD